MSPTMVRNLAERLGSVIRQTPPEEGSVATRETCLVCQASLVDSEFFAQKRVCPVCHFHYSTTARERIAQLYPRLLLVESAHLP